MHRHYLICFDSMQKQKQCGRRIFAQGYFKADRCERIKITSSLPDDLEKQLPSVEDIQKRIK